MEIVNKFDNALAGVAGDDGTTGVVVNDGNNIETGHFWDMQTCAGPPTSHDHDADHAAAAPTRDALAGDMLTRSLPGGTAAGLSAAGRTATRAA